MRHQYRILGIPIEQIGGWAEGRETSVRFVPFREARVSYIAMTEVRTEVTHRRGAYGGTYADERIVSERDYLEPNMTMVERTRAIDWQRTVVHLDDGRVATSSINSASEHVDEGMRVHAVIARFPLLGAVTVYIDGAGHVHSVEGCRNIVVRSVVNLALRTARRHAERDAVEMEERMVDLQPQTISEGLLGEVEVPGRVVVTGAGRMMRTPEGDVALPDGLRAHEGELLIAAGNRSGEGFRLETIRNVTRHTTWRTPSGHHRARVRSLTALAGAALVATVAQLSSTPLLAIGAVALAAYAFRRLVADEEAVVAHAVHEHRMRSGSRRITRIIQHNARRTGHGMYGAE
jgi:hypothetical protein